MRQTLVAGNWKMNGSRVSVKALLEQMKLGMDDVEQAEVAVCAPFVFLADVQQLLTGSPIAWGAQNLGTEPSGAFTGEISGQMLKEFGCTYVIVGHSERRNLYGESDTLVAEKFAAAQRDGLTPILCVGELLEDRENGETEAVVARQLDEVLNARAGVKALRNAVVAYEPVWAIGTGKTASPEQAQQVHAFIRNRIAEQDQKIATNIRILYGGSVKASNAEDLFGMPDIDGGLIGGASLDAAEMLAICRAA